MEQRRFFLALVLSAAILFGWSYFFSSPTPKQNSKTNQSAVNTSETPTSQQANTQRAENPENSIAKDIQLSDETIGRQTLTVSTPLYKITFDNRGAVTKSWILEQNKDTGRPLYSIASSKENRQPLELISPEGLQRGQLPLRLEIGAANSGESVDPSTIAKWNEALAARNYKIVAKNFELPPVQGENSEIEIKAGEPKREISFEMVEPGTGLRAIKTLSFNPDSYLVDVGVSVTSNERPVPEVKMVVGPSIGDQGVPHYTFYSVAPQGLIVANGETTRLLASDVNGQKTENGKGYQLVNGPVSWASVGDTYFAMALVLPKSANRVEYKTEEYQHGAENKEQRFLISALVPVPTDGSAMHLYVGPKDHFTLEATSEELSARVGSEVDLEQLIDYGWLGFTRPIAVYLLKAIKFINNLTGNYGVAIILFTIIIYMLFFPLKWRSTKSMKKAQKHAPRMKELQEKIKGLKANDPRLKELQMEQLRLMKEANPLGGCLPLLIQMPFLIALYSAITISIDFRQASFLWMPDLSAADPIRLLPILMAASMLILQLITPNPSADPLQRKMMAVVLPVMMLYMLWSAPSGLLLYWLVGNIVGFGQQVVINKMVKSGDDSDPPGKKQTDAKSKPKLGVTSVSQA